MPLRFTFRQLEYLVAVGEAGSIALASDKLNVSSPSISSAISQLENELGVQIFVRQHAQGLSLTAGGRRIFNEAREILFRAGTLTDLAGDIRQKPGGPIAVGCLITIAPLVGAAIRRSFQAEFSDAAVSLREAHQAQLLHMLGRAEIDVALTYDLDIPSDIAFSGLLEMPPYVMVAADHPLAGRGEVALGEIAAEPMVLLDLPMTRDYFLSMFHAEGLRPNIAERTGEIAVSRTLVANGFGYGFVNARTRSHHAADGRELAFLRLKGDHRPMVLGLASKRSAHRARIATAFEDHVRGLVESQTLPGILVD